jgi:hypothetical protein
MVGITMVLAIAICIFGAAAFFALLARPFSDFIPVVAPAAQVGPAETPVAPAVEAEPTSDQQTEEQPEPTAAPANNPTVAPVVENFEPSHQIGASSSVNFRAGPSTDDGIILALSPATPLEYLDEEQPTTNPSDGDRWMRFRTEDGEEGWVREIDTVAYQP